MNKQLIKKLEILKQKDIDAVNNLLSDGKLYGQYDKELQKIHTENALELDEIISIYGWPTLSKVGLEGTRLAWLIAQHSICTPVLQRKFFKILCEECKKGEVPKRQVAFLSDRIRFNEGRPQIYGTILDWDEKGEFSCEIEDPDNLDVLRKDVGLPPFKEYIKKSKKEITIAGGQPPENYLEYQSNVEEWAKNLGWR